MFRFPRHRQSGAASRPVLLGIGAFIAVLYILDGLSGLWTGLVAELSPIYRSAVVIAALPVLILVTTVAMVIWGKWRHRRTRSD